MAKTAHYFTQFELGEFYHIYNRSVDKKPMFKNNGNYIFFLKKYHFYLSQVLDTHAYCLLGNHFHLLVRIKSDLHSANDSSKQQNTHEVVSHQFRKFFQSYAMAFNKQQNRVGTLFQTPFKRVLVDSEDYFTKLVYYIHANPQHHRLTTDFRNWDWSSYKDLIADKESNLKKKEVLDWFYDKNTFINYHEDVHQQLINDVLSLEND